MSDTYVVGDTHGQFDRLAAVLQRAHLVDAALAWAGGTATLWFLGDFVDRGPAGLAVIDLVMRLQGEAAAAGGAVHALLGNHEPLLLAARRFGAAPCGGPGGTFLSAWRANGGVEADLVGLTPAHEAWLSSLPAMALVGSDLIIHADAALYLRYGDSLDAVNRAFAALLHSDDPARWDQLLDDFSERDAFLQQPALVDSRLRQFGGKRIIHGHTPIYRQAGLPPEAVTGPFVYDGGRCVNLDPGLYAGWPGFVWQLG